MTDPRGNQGQAEFWEARSSSWIKQEDWTALVTGSFGRRAMQQLTLTAGSRVLDVGCGTGPTTRELARRVAPGGEVVGLDIAQSMLAVARLRAQQEGIRNVEFTAGDAETAVLGEGAFDAVFSQFGVMFFADPEAAFTNLRRALRGGGRIAFACWQDVFVNDWALVPGGAVVAVTGQFPPMPGQGEPGPFSLADPSHVEQLLRAAGFDAIDVVPVAEPIVLSADRVQMVVDAATQFGVVREALEGNDDPAFSDRVRSAVRDALSERVHDGELRLNAAALVVTAEVAAR